jgi:hypothetical protein
MAGAISLANELSDAYALAEALFFEFANWRGGQKLRARATICNDARSFQA